MLGAPSLKFYALLATFVLGLIAFRAEMQVTKQRAPRTAEISGEIAITPTSSAALIG